MFAPELLLRPDEAVKARVMVGSGGRGARPPLPAPGGATPPRLLDQVRAQLRLRHYSPRTEATYVSWIRRFILFHGKKHPLTLGTGHVAVFLTHLATQEQVSASTQNQALNALVFLYSAVLQRDGLDFGGFVRARKPRHLPVVLSPAEAASCSSGSGAASC